MDTIPPITAFSLKNSILVGIVPPVLATVTVVIPLFENPKLPSLGVGAVKEMTGPSLLIPITLDVSKTSVSMVAVHLNS